MGEDVCVIDGHAWCIANKDRRTMQEVPSIGKKLRQELQTSYSRAGKKHGMTAYEMQAATWVAWKRIHNV
jgi:Holliday junction resolvasome RuvABC DNA-binding subunit